MTAPATLPLAAEAEVQSQKRDLAGFAHPAARLAWLAAHARTPFAIGVSGPRGSGKSSLLHMTAEALAPQKVLVRRFDAAAVRHEARTSLPLIGAILARLAGEGGRENELKRRMFHALLVPSGFEARWGQVSVSDLEKLIERVERDMLAHAEILAEPQRFRDDMEELVDLALKPSGASRLVLVVDSLDLCPAEGALEFLERFQHFFKGGRAVLLAAVDDQALGAAAARRHGPAEAAAAVARLLDVVYPCPVPRPAEAVRFVVHRLRELLGHAEGHAPIRAERWETLSLHLGDPTNANLRRLSRTVKTLATLFLLYPPLLEEGPEYFLLLSLRLHHPEAWRALRLHGPALAGALAQVSPEACAALGAQFSEDMAAAVAERHGPELAPLVRDRGLLLLAGNLALNVQRLKHGLPEFLPDRMAKLEKALSLA